MAAIGHSCVGLSLSGLGLDQDRHRVLSSMWPGLLILLAYAMDVAEWAAWLISPEFFERRVGENSTYVAAIIVLFSWGGLLIARCRRVVPYLTVAAAVLSHLVLDLPDVERGLIRAYGFAGKDRFHAFGELLVSEAWFYGGVLVLVVLLRTLAHPHLRARARIASAALGLAAGGAAMSRMPALWGPVYALSLLHGGMVLRRGLGRRLAWSAVPLLPLMIYVASEVRASQFVPQVLRLEGRGRYEEAIIVCREAIAFPCRTPQHISRVILGRCLLEAGRPDEAQTALLESWNNQPADFHAPYGLAKFYADPRLRGTPYYRPDEAVRILQTLEAGPHADDDKALARALLQQIRTNRAALGT